MLTSVTVVNSPTLNFRVLNQSGRDFIGRVDYADIEVADDLGAKYAVICCFAGARAFTVRPAERYDFSVPLGPQFKPAATSVVVSVGVFSGARDLIFRWQFAGLGKWSRSHTSWHQRREFAHAQFPDYESERREFLARVDYSDILATDNVGTTYSVICCYTGAMGFAVPAGERRDFNVPLGPTLKPAATELSVVLSAFSGTANVTFKLRL